MATPTEQRGRVKSHRAVGCCDAERTIGVDSAGMASQRVEIRMDEIRASSHCGRVASAVGLTRCVTRVISSVGCSHGV